MVSSALVPCSFRTGTITHKLFLNLFKQGSPVKPELTLNAKFLYSLTANCQLLIIIRGMIALRLGEKRKNKKLC